MNHPLPARWDNLLDPANPPELLQRARAGVASRDTIEAAVAAAQARKEVNPTQRPLLLAALLLWHDHCEQAHRLVQDDDSPTGAWIHAIVHRREPDYWNAKYWLRRAACPGVGEVLTAQLTAFITSLATKAPVDLLSGGGWDALRMVDACEQWAANPATPPARFLREVQRIELQALVAALTTRS